MGRQQRDDFMSNLKKLWDCNSLCRCPRNHRKPRSVLIKSAIAGLRTSLIRILHPCSNSTQRAYNASTIFCALAISASTFCNRT